MISLVFYDGRSLISRLIKKVTGSKASHVAVGCTVHGIPCIIHATAKGVIIQPRRAYEKHSKVVQEYRFTKDMEPGLRKSILHIGEKYDYISLVGQLLGVMLWRRLMIRVKWNPFASGDKTVCSEFVTRIDDYPNEFIEEWRTLIPELTTPGMLLEICQANKFNNFERIK